MDPGERPPASAGRRGLRGVRILAGLGCGSTAPGRPGPGGHRVGRDDSGEGRDRVPGLGVPSEYSWCSPSLARVPAAVPAQGFFDPFGGRPAPPGRMRSLIRWLDGLTGTIEAAAALIADAVGLREDGRLSRAISDV